MHAHRLFLAPAAVVACLALVPPTATAAECGGSVACPVEGGEYRIALPPGGAATGAYVFFHGYRGSAEGQMKSASLIEVAHRHGLAFVAPDGAGRTWSHPGAPSRNRDEIRFVAAVLDDLEARFGFGADEVVAGGFSQGASMALYALCAHPARFAGAVTFAGVFWSPIPEAQDCAGPPPPIVHIHGRSDGIFPLAGRPIGESWRQADTFDSMAVLAEAGACAAEPAAAGILPDMDCTVTAGCAREPMALCLHAGGHEVRAPWLDAALDALGQ
ncbi:MAG TPA: alpha/beta fold hydrolase [Methylomirabilota bacterium]|nr:alpha/beta fold hydrolase [Methylomirabilota bacterium]